MGMGLWVRAVWAHSGLAQWCDTHARTLLLCLPYLACSRPTLGVLHAGQRHHLLQPRHVGTVAQGRQGVVGHLGGRAGGGGL